ncbi:MAG: N-acetylneuraminate synthase family protein [Minisyncoccia bacterium]
MMPTVDLKSEKKVFIIAEIGKNFIQTEDDRSVAEYLDNAKKLTKAAKDAGADAVKFQTHEVEDEVLNIDFTSPHFKAKERYSWVTRNTEATPLEEFWKPLKVYCEEIGILFFSTPMSHKAAKKLNEVGVPFWKIGSGDIQDHVLFEYLIETKKPVIISSGMVSLEELNAVVQYAQKKGAPLAVLYCISQYPAPPEYFNLATIPYLVKKYPGVRIGFSDHSLGDEVARAAVAVGASIIEKHFSFSRDLWGADHKVSMTPEEFAIMVHKIRAHDLGDPTPYLGEEGKELEGANNRFRPFFNKALMAATDIPAGTRLTKDMIFAMRPVSLAGGLPAHELPNIVGRTTTSPLKKYDPITMDSVA